MNSRRAAWSSIQQLSSRSLVDGGIVVLGLVEEGGIVDVQVCVLLVLGWFVGVVGRQRRDYEIREERRLWLCLLCVYHYHGVASCC